MAKRKPKAAKPAKPAKPYMGGDFAVLQDDMMDQLNTLTLAVHALQGCHELDSSDLGSKARNVLCLCDHELHQLMNQLEEWEIQNRPAD